MTQESFSMPKFAIGEVVDKATGDHSHGVVVAVFPTIEGSYEYAIDTRIWCFAVCGRRQSFVPH